jgi:hypothetical protein
MEPFGLLCMLMLSFDYQNYQTQKKGFQLEWHFQLIEQDNNQKLSEIHQPTVIPLWPCHSLA